jgi:hypothetical protein
MLRWMKAWATVQGASALGLCQQQLGAGVARRDRQHADEPRPDWLAGRELAIVAEHRGFATVRAPERQLSSP